VRLYSCILADGDRSMPCRAAVSGISLLIYPDGQPMQTWALGSTEIQRARGTLRISHAATVLKVEGSDADAIWQEVNSAAPPAKKKGHFTFSVLAVIGLAGLAITILIAVALYTYLPKLAGKAAGMVPIDYEIRLGESIAENYLNQSVPASDSVAYYVDRFVRALKLDSRYPIRARVIVSDEINAFAVPGGNIFIYSGLLGKMTSYEELVALLGHEVTHVVRRHSLRSLFSRATTGIVISAMLGNSGGFGQWAVSQADELKQLDYSRELETEADNYGLGIMSNNDVDPAGMLRLLNLLKQESIEDPGLMQYLSTHPETEARIRNVESNVANISEHRKDPYFEHLFGKIREHLDHSED
jgi:beta-barrel assembly-enhancing protease